MEEEKVISEEKTTYDGVLQLALEVGAGILSSGGSVSRVETAVDRICRAYGAEEANVAAFPSMIIASVRMTDGSEESYMKRVYSTSNNLSLLEKYNQLSRDICHNKYPIVDGLRMCFELAHSKTRNKWVTIAGASLVSGIYSIFFGGTVADVLPALLVAFVMSLLNEVLSKRSLNAYATTFLLSLVGGVLSVSLCKLLNVIGLPCQCAYVMIGTIMILIPGLLTTNAMRDMFTGDLMSGTFQLLNGILLAVVIAAGYGVSILALSPIADFTKGTFTGWYYLIDNTTWFRALMLMVSGSLGAGAVCLFFNLNLKRIGWAMLASVLALGVYVGMLEIFKYNNDYVFLIVLIPTLFAAILSEIMARKIKIPATIILVPAIIAVVPGSSLYYTMEAIVSPNMAAPDMSASKWGVICLLTLLSIAVGICAIAVLFHLISPVKLKFYKKNKIADARKAARFNIKKNKDK